MARFVSVKSDGGGLEKKIVKRRYGLPNVTNTGNQTYTNTVDLKSIPNWEKLTVTNNMIPTYSFYGANGNLQSISIALNYNNTTGILTATTTVAYGTAGTTGIYMYVDVFTAE
ncbi:MAG: hypothetical protein QM697_00150 [Lachnospiraceae bacterium]